MLVSARAGRTVLGLLLGLADVALVFATHVLAHEAFTKEELFLHGGLLATAYACLSAGGFKDIADAYKEWKSS